MSNIYKAFEKKKAFIPFVTGGDPSLDVTEQLLYAMEEAGADLIEIGIPFSDPTAEGPVIQEANERALQAGCTTDRQQAYEKYGTDDGCSSKPNLKVSYLCKSNLYLRKRTIYEKMYRMRNRWNYCTGHAL